MTNLQGKPFTLSQPIHPWALNRDVVKKDIMKSHALLKLSCSELRARNLRQPPWAPQGQESKAC